MKRKIILLILLLVILGLLFERQIRQSRQDIHYSDVSITLGEVREELTFAAYENMDWDNLFKKEHAPLKAEEVQQILQKLGLADEITLPEEKSTKRISRSDWNTIYRQILDFTDSEQTVSQETLLLMDFIETEDGCILVTNSGEFSSTLPDTYYTRWQTYDLYLAEGRCLGVAALSEEESRVCNVYLTNYEDRKLTFLSGGSTYNVSVEAIQPEIPSGVADLVFAKGKLTAIRSKQETIEGNLLSYDDTTIEIEGFGRLLHTGKLPVYQTLGGDDSVTEKSISDVVLGNQKITYVIGEAEVCAILITSPVELRTIRVLLLNDAGGIYRPELFLKADTDVTITDGTDTLISPAESVIDIGTFFSDDSKTIRIQSDAETAQIYLCDAVGNLCSNGYEGTMEVRKQEAGYTLINVLSLEHYLYAVVPSEMPSSYEMEALKAQAVCARSYAYRQLKKADLASYGAHIDDSTSYQVYNKIPKTEASIQAVDETAGEVITYAGEVVEAFYFSTSMGYTDTAEVWNVTDETQYPYLKKACLVESEERDLSGEETFKTFISEKVPGYDSEMPYYRWTADCDFTQKEELLCQIFEERHSISPDNVLYYESDGVTACESAKALGTLQSVAVTERSTSGFILTLRFTFQNGVVDVKSEYNIRKLLALGVETLICQDGSTRTEISLLPSAACTVERQSDGRYHLSGGGFGHGLGMSQNGANGLAKTGASYTAILKFFYHDIEIGQAEEEKIQFGGLED